MKRNSSIKLVFLCTAVPLSLAAQMLTWDPNGSAPGTSVSGNWDTTALNWTVTADSGANQAWVQGYDAVFGVEADYTVTLVEPIALLNLSVSGGAGSLSIAGNAANHLTLASSSIFGITGRTLNLSAPVGGSFSMSKSGSGTLLLSGANTYSEGTFISTGSGAIGLAADTVAAGGVITSGPLGTGMLTVSSAGHMLFASGAPRVVENPVVLLAGLAIGGSQALTFRNGAWQVSGGTRILTVSNTALTRIESNLTDDGTARTLQKSGTGTLVLAGDNSAYLGQLTLNTNSGTLMIGSDIALQVGAVVTVNSGSTLDLNGYNGRVVGLSGSGSTLLGAGTLTIANSVTSRNFTGVISGTGGLVISNAISQQLEGNNTFNGGITLVMGTVFLRTNATTVDHISRAAGTGIITIDDIGATPRPAVGANYSGGLVRITNSIFVKTGRGLFFPSNGGANQFDGLIYGPGGFLRDNNGSGLVILPRGNSFAGGLQIESRAIALGHKNAIGTGEFVIGSPTTAPANAITIAALVGLGGANAITNSTTVNQSFTVFGTNDLELSGPLTLASPATLTIAGGGSVTLSGSVGGVGGLTKAGTNNLTLMGANTYGGGTTVSAGTLLVNNRSGSGTGSGSVSVQADAALGGTGTIQGAVSVALGGAIGAGTSVGKLTIEGGLDLSQGGTNNWELATEKDESTGVAGVDFDQISVTGGQLTLGGSSVLMLRFAGSPPLFGNPFWQGNHTWRVLAKGAGASGGSAFSAIAGTNGIQSGTFATSLDGGGNVILSYTAAAVPPAPVISGNIPGAGTTSATIGWSSVNGIMYEVQYKDDLNVPNWSTLGSVTAGGSTASIVDSTDPPATNRFYRILVQ